MKAKQIEALRNERLTQMRNFQEQLKNIKNDGMYSEEYRASKIKEINEQLANVRHDYEMRINELVSISRQEAIKKLDEAEFSNFSAESGIKLLIKEMRNKDLADGLVGLHKSDAENGNKELGIAGSPLYKKAKEAVENNLSNAPAYITALKRLGLSGYQELENQYKEANMTQGQMTYKKALDAIEEQAHLYEADKTSESNPLHGALLERYGNR